MSEGKIDDSSIHAKSADEPLTSIAKSQNREDVRTREENGKEERKPLTWLDRVGMGLMLLAMGMMVYSLFKPGAELSGSAAVVFLLAFALGNAARKDWFWVLMDISYAVIFVTYTVASKEQLPALKPLMYIVLIVPIGFVLVRYGAKGISKLLKKHV